ncbi:trypsin-like serine protease [Streptosporangiaceae bacterium NEAU-GS5]|nr:trypsin-like serine protease [Streptosporangiaceae bacterium NEAU-GS5]
MTRRLVLTLGGMAALSAVAALGAGTPATASAPTSATVTATTAANGVFSTPLAGSSSDMQKVAAYWTPDKIRRASTLGPTAKPSSSPGTSAAEVAPPKTKAAPKTKVKKAARGQAGPPMVGKVFFKLGGREYWCSGSVVHSKNHNLVATAGHCAYSLTSNRAVEDWIFIPSYVDGRSDAGIYVGQTLYLHEDFRAGDFDRDYAFVTVYPGYTWNNGRQVAAGRLEDRVGAFVFSSAIAIGRKVSIFAYPAGPHPDGSSPYSGQSVVHCDGVTDKRWVASPTWALERGIRLEGCPYTAGASGGPWVLGYNAARKTGYLNGVVSLTWNLNADGKLDAVSTPWFNGATRRVYAQAAG